MIVGDNYNQEYFKIFTIGGLATPSNALNDYVSSCFAIFDEVHPTIKRNGLPEERGRMFLTTDVTSH